VNPREYPTLTPGELRGELATQVDFLCAEHVRLARCLSDHQRAYWHAYQQSDGTSVSARQQDASRFSLPDWCEVLEIRGEINATAVKVDLLRALLGLDGKVSQRDTFPPDKMVTALT